VHSHWQFNISFSYPEKREGREGREGTEATTIINNLTLNLEPGRVYGLCGKSGAGKSTFIKLLSGEERPTSGEILLNGIPIEEIDPADLSNCFRFNSQKVNELEGLSIHEGLEIGARGELSEEDVEKALYKSGVDFEDDTSVIVGDGFGIQDAEGNKLIHSQKFSGGQNSRLATARAVVGDPLVLVLDDGENERIVLERVVFPELNKEDRTIIVSMHNLNRLAAADSILVFEEGKGITEVGSHAELIELDGHYAKLFRSGEELDRIAFK
jgi:ABC-type multidrug transport system fused ATPase/permease subunit